MRQVNLSTKPCWIGAIPHLRVLSPTVSGKTVYSIAAYDRCIIAAQLLNYRGHKGTSRSKRAIEVLLQLACSRSAANCSWRLSSYAFSRAVHMDKKVCTGLQDPRSCGVKVGETKYRHNCRQIIPTKEMPEPREASTAKTED